MLLFTKKTLYILVICVMFGLNIGLLMFVSRSDADVCPYFSSPELCYATVGGASAGLSFAAWPLLSSSFKTYLALASILPISRIFAASLSILLYTETLKPLRHHHTLRNARLDEYRCLLEEVSYQGVCKVLRSLYYDSLLEEMKESDIMVEEARLRQFKSEIELMNESDCDEIVSSLFSDNNENKNLKNLIDSFQNQFKKMIEPLSSTKESIEEISKIMENDAYYYDWIGWALKYIVVLCSLFLYPIIYSRNYNTTKSNVDQQSPTWKKAVWTIFCWTWDLVLITYFFLYTDIHSTQIRNDKFFETQKTQFIYLNRQQGTMLNPNEVQQVGRINQALEKLGRKCARPAPPIDYGYQVFLLAFVMRIAYIYGTLKLAWLPAFICAHFDKSEYVIPASVKEEKDVKREKDIVHKMVPWMERLSLTAAD